MKPAWFGSPVPALQLTFSFSAACSACQGFSATTPTKFFLTTHLDQAGHACDGTFVDALDRCADGRRANDAAVQHARHAHVVDEFELAGDDLGDIETVDRLSEHGPFAGRLALGVRIEREVEFLAADQLAIGHSFGCIAGGGDDSVGGSELIHGHTELLRRHFNERLARGGRGLSQILVIEIRRVRLAARRVGLIRRQRRIAVDQLHAVEWDGKLFSHQLRLRCDDALPQLFFATIGRHAAVGCDGDPGINFVDRWRTGRRPAELSMSRLSSQIHHAEADDESAGSLQEATAGERG